MINLMKIRGIVLRHLGVTDLSKGEDGREMLTDEQATRLTELFGAEFVVKFRERLSAADAENDAEDILSAVRDHFAGENADLKTQLADALKNVKTLQQTVEQLAADPEPPIVPKKADGGISGSAKGFRVDMNTSYNKAAVEMLQTGRFSAGETTLDVEPLRREFGTYISQGNNLEIFKKIYSGFPTAKYMTPKTAITEYRAVSGLITSIVQQFTPKWTPAGSGKFTPIVIKNRRHKINVSIVPAEVVDSWLLHLYDESLTVDQMPITRYIINEHILPAVLNDIELRMIAKGKFTEKAWSTVNSGDKGGAPEDAMDGFETVLTEAKKSADKGINFYGAKINPLTCSESELLQFFDGFVDWISPMYQTANMSVFVGGEVFRRYKRAYKNKWGAGSGTEKVDFGEDRIDFTNFALVKLDSMYRSPIVFSTPKQNFIMLQNRNSPTNVINDIQKADYEVRIFGEFWLGTGFAIGEAVFAYVPDNYTPYDTIAGSWGPSDEPSAWVPGEVAAIEKPVITTQPEAVSFDDGGKVELSVVATGTSLSYQWYKDGQAIDSATSSKLMIAAAHESDAGNYQCIVSNSTGYALSQVAKVSLNSL